MTNKELIDRYPFLIPRNVFTDKVVIDLEADEIEYTLLDEMPKGWRIAFGEQMCEEIREVLIKYDYLNEYRIVQIKEKFGGLRWYDDGAPKEVFDIINKYEDISYTTCIQCGKPATLITKGWISPFCDDCAKSTRAYELYGKDYFRPIDKYYGGNTDNE